MHYPDFVSRLIEGKDPRPADWPYRLFLPYWRAFFICLRSIPAVPTGLLSDNFTFIDVLGRKMSLSYADFRYWPVSIPCHRLIRLKYNQMYSNFIARCFKQDSRLHSAAYHGRKRYGKSSIVC